MSSIPPVSPQWLKRHDVIQRQGSAQTPVTVHRYVIDMEKKGSNKRKLVTIEIVGTADQKTQIASHIILLKSTRSTWKLLANDSQERGEAFKVGRKIELAREPEHSSVIFKENQPENAFFYKDDTTKQVRGSLEEKEFRQTAAANGYGLNLTGNSKNDATETILQRCDKIADTIFKGDETAPPTISSAPATPRLHSSQPDATRTRSFSAPINGRTRTYHRSRAAAGTRTHRQPPLRGTVAQRRQLTLEQVRAKVEALNSSIPAERANIATRLFPVDIRDDVLSSQLPNLGGTCYMNSALQLMARFPDFDRMLMTNPLQDSVQLQLGILMGKLADPTPKLQEINRDIDHLTSISKYVERCQENLCAIINRMRAGERIVEKDLRNLFVLMQKCGWNATEVSQQDPHELIQFLRKIFGATECPIQLESTLNDGFNPPHLTNSTPQFELNVNLIPNKTMSEMINEHLNEQIVDEGSRRGLPQPVVAVKSSVLTAAPQTLFVQLKRFDFVNRQGVKNVQPVGGLDQIQIPVKEDGQTVPVLRTYRLKACITHHGQSAKSGHYTAVVRQEINQHKGWVKYNDGFPPQVASTDQKIDQENQIGGYYLAYELLPQNPTCP